MHIIFVRIVSLFYRKYSRCLLRWKTFLDNDDLEYLNQDEVESKLKIDLREAEASNSIMNSESLSNKREPYTLIFAV